jgi:NitT/TauT family transport system substrate-binding protein
MKRHLIRLAAAIGSALLVAGAASAGTLRLVVTDLTPPLVPNSVMDLAVELGYFAREGVEVKLIRVQQTPSAIAAMLAGEGDMANVGVDALLQLKVRGDETLIAVTSPNKALPFLIAAREGITAPADLAGKSFGVGRIGSLDYALSSRVLASEGVSFDAMKIVTLGQPSVRARALAAGRVDATTMSIGTWLSIPDRAGLSILVPQEAYYRAAPVVNKVNVVRRDYLAAHRADVVAVVRALTKISRDFAADPDAWAAAMEPHAPTMTPATLRDLARSFAGSWSVNGGMGRDELQFTEDWVFGTPDFKGAKPVPLESWVDFSVADEVLGELGVDPSADAPAR